MLNDLIETPEQRFARVDNECRVWKMNDDRNKQIERERQEAELNFWLSWLSVSLLR